MSGVEERSGDGLGVEKRERLWLTRDDSRTDEKRDCDIVRKDDFSTNYFFNLFIYF